MAEQPPPRKPTRSAIQARAPWLPAPWEIADAGAVQRLAAGTATSEDQRRVLAFIVNDLAGTYDLSFRPGNSEGDRETAFAEGKRFVGLQLVKLANVALSRLRRSVKP